MSYESYWNIVNLKSLKPLHNDQSTIIYLLSLLISTSYLLQLYSGVAFDREHKPKYKVTMICSDHARKPKSSTMSVMVSLFSIYITCSFKTFYILEDIGGLGSFREWVISLCACVCARVEFIYYYITINIIFIWFYIVFFE